MHANSYLSPKWIQWKHRTVGYTHCQSCLALDKCWFTSDNKPKLPQHEKCHCTVSSIPTTYVDNYAAASSAYSKFVPYLFNTTGIYSHGKEEMLASWGYTAEDAVWLQKEIEHQALEKYRKGQYTLGKLDINGQRLSIEIEIPRRNGSGTISFISGWMLNPYGSIKLTTP